MTDLEQQFGAIDIYLFDQLLRGRITVRDRVFDAGCGWGRNLVYLLRSGCEVFGADARPDAIAEVRSLAKRSRRRCRGELSSRPLEHMTFPDGFATVVISSAVLHFAGGDAQFDAMLKGRGACSRRAACFLPARLVDWIRRSDQPIEPGSRRCVLPAALRRGRSPAHEIRTSWAGSCSIPSRPPWCRTGR